MKKSTLTALLALWALGSSTTASAVSVTLVADQLRTASGTLYTKFIDGSDGSPASTATWDWDGSVLTQTGGVFYTTRRIGSVPNGSILETDQIVGLRIDTAAQTTTATSYNCIEGTFGAGTGSSICGNINLSDDFALNSTLQWNVGGNADCISKTIGGDDIDGGSLRGLTTHAASGACTAQVGAYMRYNASLAGNVLTLNNGLAISSPGSIQFTFNVSEVPVPAAAWFIAPAAGLLAPWARRRKSSAA